MTNGDLLQLLRDAILNDRTSRVSGSSDYLWTDATLLTYMDEAQRRFAVRGLVLRDGTLDETTKITLVAGQEMYPVHESVIAVISAKVASQATDLTRVGHAVLAGYRTPTDSWIAPHNYSQLPAGPPLAYSTDEEVSDFDTDSRAQINMRVHPVPGADQAGEVIRLRVVRKPLEQISASTLGSSPEIPEDHHIEMLDWAAYLALRIVDDDAGSPKRAADFKATFEQHVVEARTLVLRKLFAPMGWGFGHSGFSWER